MKIVAHRGDTAMHPENTLAAFQTALDNGADAIELDVHASKDGALIVHHDYYLDQLDDQENCIHQNRLESIQACTINGTEKIPQLHEVFELIGDKMHYELELKGMTIDFLQAVIDLVKKHNLASNIEFTSPSQIMLIRLKELEPTFVTGLFAPPRPSWMDVQLSRDILVSQTLLGRMTVLHCPLDMIDEDLIRSAHGHGLKVHAADCNTKEALQSAFELGVDQLSTDRLALALSVRT